MYVCVYAYTTSMKTAPPVDPTDKPLSARPLACFAVSVTVSAGISISGDRYYVVIGREAPDLAVSQ